MPGEFPNDWSLLPGHVRWNRADAADLRGERTGLFEIHTSRDALVITGNALGGGSQINASVAMRADTRLFREPHWPREFRDSEQSLDGSYSMAERMLEVTPYPGDGTPKFDALKALSGLVAEAVKFADWTATAPPATAFHAAPLAVTFASGVNLAGVEQKACLRCGDCVTGCNFGAKNTLTMNYLPDAWRHGAEMFSEVEVLAVLPRAGGSGARVYLRDARDDAEVVIDPLREQPARDPQPRGIADCECIEADFVVIAAGALGSTEILLRSRAFSAAFFSGESALDGVRRLRLSERLGAGFSGNGDGLGFGVEHRARINGVGLGAAAVAGEKYTIGPTITGVIDTRPGLPVAKGVLIQDGAIPGALSRFFTEMAATSGSVAQLDRWFRKRDCDDHAALPDGIATHTQTYLMMGHDNADGRIVLRKGRATVQWPKAKAQPGAYRQHRLAALCERDGAVYVQNPTAKPVPDKLRAIFSGPAVEGPPIIVHPLGGCAMADRHADGVVNHMGEVFDGLGAESVVENLFVWDGSILPGSVGANPFLTIAALAERAVVLVLKREAGIARNGRAWTSRPPRDLPPLPEVPPAAAPPAHVTSIDWRESMRGKIDFGGRPHSALLRVAFPFSDVADFVTRKSAAIVITPKFLADLRFRPPRRDVPLVQGAQPEREFFGLRIQPVKENDSAAMDFELLHGVVRLLDHSPRNRWLRALLLPLRYLRTLFVWLWKRRSELWANLQKLVLQWRQTLREILAFLMSPLADTRSDLDAAAPPVTLVARLRMHWPLVKHASDVRVMDYHLVFDGGQSQAGKPFILKGRKTLRYSLHGNLWDDLMTLRLRGDLVKHGSLKLDAVALAEGDRPHLHSDDDLPNALMRMAGLAAYFFRALFPPYIWDFRLPDYPSAARQRVTLPGRQPVVGIDGAIVADAWIEPQRHWLMVPADQRDPLDRDDRFPSYDLAPPELETSRLALLLTCFRTPVDANRKGPILLLHGFGQSSLGFGAHTIAVNLVQYLCAQGYEVWTLDYRATWSRV